ncbi:MAG: DUF1559 domain-containing protein [Planctomycetota bacterium]
MAAATWLAPLAAIAQSDRNPRGAGSPLTPQTVAVANLQVGRLLASSAAQLWPTEVLGAAGLQYAGFDPRTIEEVTITIEPPMGTLLYYTATVRFTEPFDLDSLSPEVLSKLTPVEGPGGQRVYAVDPNDPSAPLLMMVDTKTLLAAPRGMLKKLTKPGLAPAEGPFFDWLARRTGRVDLHVGVHFTPLRPLAKMAIAAGMQRAREEQSEENLAALEQLSKAPDEIRYVEAWADISSRSKVAASVEALDEASADRLAALLVPWRNLYLSSFDEVADEMDPSDPTQSALADYLDRIGPRYADAMLPARNGTRFYAAFPPGDPKEQLGQFVAQTAVIGVLVALLLPAVQAAREAARRNTSLYNVKQLCLALSNYHDVNSHFPPFAITSADGRPLLSWRVAMLPYVGEQALYDRFALDEPWDSPTNLPLVSQMPEFFLDPSGQLVAASGKTHYLGVVGEDAFFAADLQPRRFATLRDGTATTIAIVQVDDENAVEWTKPADYRADKLNDNPFGAQPPAGNPFERIGSLHPGVFLTGWADGHAAAVRTDTDPETFRAYLTVNGGERVEAP